MKGGKRLRGKEKKEGMGRKEEKKDAKMKTLRCGAEVRS